MSDSLPHEKHGRFIAVILSARESQAGRSLKSTKRRDPLQFRVKRGWGAVK